MAAALINDYNYEYLCVPCDRVFVGKDDFLSHLRRTPHAEPILCGKCNQEYHHVTSLIRHIKNTHIQEAQNNDVILDQMEVDGAVGDGVEENPDGGGGDADHGDQIEQVSEEESSHEEIVDLVRSAGQMTLNLRQSGSVTGSAIERFQHECFKMVRDTSKSLKQKVKIFLADENINTPQFRALLQELHVDDPFSQLRTMKQQLKYFSSELGLVPPETKFLDYRVDYKLNTETLQYEPTREALSFEYIPVIKTLTLLMKNEKIRNLIDAETASQDGILRSCLDGRRAQTHPLVSRFPKILRLQLYWDDVEVVNPLGSKTTIHKIAAFYSGLPDWATCRHLGSSRGRLKKGGDFWAPRALPSGDISYQASGNPDFTLAFKIYLLLRALSCPLFIYLLLLTPKISRLLVDLRRATLTVLCADSLAAHDIMGLLSPSARHFCRYCMVSRPDFRANLLAVGERRTKAMLEDHVRMVRERRSREKECGVRKSCSLHLSRGFDATCDIIFDCFHDLLEGVCHWVISLSLRSFINASEYFSLKQFNGRIAAFNYGVNDFKNTPSVNFTVNSLNGSKLKQTGSQMWCLTRIFGFLVADVPEGDENLKLVNLLQAILLIVFSEAVRAEDITRLEELIAEHHILFQRLHVTPENDVFDELSDDENDAEDIDDPDDPAEGEAFAENQRRRAHKKVTPENILHHLVHYPEVFRDHGSLNRYWCARYEGRHQIFSNYRAEEMELQGPQNISVEQTQHMQLLVQYGLIPNCEVCDVEAVSIAGETHRPGLFVVVDSSTPTFAIIKYINVKGKEVLFVLKSWETVAFEN
ncbi:Zinc finger protein 585B [Frankliniella fusca]|uniref:Zinc finger protein 585B n=1 Tax=Frankliniella fusca TaxID=407009 RepID=A0AAE1HPA0_9NEOP|nr:Zinc finger protein 585B [Frankliniella fusca]